jgi:hypothetical protein
MVTGTFTSQVNVNGYAPGLCFHKSRTSLPQILAGNHLIFIPGMRGIVSTSSSDLTISFVPVLYFIKCGD